MISEIQSSLVEAPLKERIEDFLAQKRIAVVGVSRKREDAANINYRSLKERGYEVIPVNPHADTFEGDTCYPNLAAIPQKPDAVFIVTNPSITESVVEEAIAVGIPRIWMHCSLGTHPGLMKNLAQKIGSVSAPAVEKAQKEGISVIPGACPMMYMEPKDKGHRFMRGMLKTMRMIR